MIYLVQSIEMSATQEVSGEDLVLITPSLTVVQPEEVRYPQDDEVLLAHGVELDTMRSGKIGELAIRNPLSPIPFSFRKGIWHTDPQYVQLHLTVEGRCRARFMGAMINGNKRALPYRIEGRRFVRGLMRNSLQVDVEENDLLVFNGAYHAQPMIHRFDSLERNRQSLAFTHVRPSG